MNEKDLKFNRGTSMWKGKMLMDMTRDELIDAFWEFGQLYKASEKQHMKDLSYHSSLIKDKKYLWKNHIAIMNGKVYGGEVYGFNTVEGLFNFLGSGNVIDNNHHFVRTKIRKKLFWGLIAYDKYEYIQLDTHVN